MAISETGDGLERPGAPAVEVIYERVFQAIVEHRLPPGTKLGEDRLADVFKVTRGRIRQVLARLAHEGIVTQQPNRGAFVREPSIEEARAVFEARRVIEPTLVRLLIERLDDAKLQRLRAIYADEMRARATRDRRAIVRLSGEFHVVLAELVGNPMLLQTVRELASLTCLIIYLYDAPTMPACREEEHLDLLEAIAARDAGRAAALMTEHLMHVESCLDLRAAAREDEDLEAIFS